jgi:hypothetical protein
LTNRRFSVLICRFCAVSLSGILGLLSKETDASVHLGPTGGAYAINFMSEFFRVADDRQTLSSADIVGSLLQNTHSE